MSRQHTALSVNVNKVALVRNTRHLGIPSVTRAATLCLQAGAHGITVHPRPDQRHVRTSDVFELGELLKAWPDREYNIEGNPFHNLMEVAREVKARGLPLHQLTFVPDSEGQFTSDHGWAFPADAERLKPVIVEARALGARVSLFMDPEPAQMAAAKAVGADRVELYTEPYAAAWHTAERDAQLERYRAAAQAALDVGLGVNAGHDLNRDNLGAFVRTVPGVADRDFLQARYGPHKGGQVVTVEVVASIQTKAHIECGLGGGGIALQLHGVFGRAPACGIGLGVKLHAVSAHSAGGCHLLGQRVHEQAHAHAQRLAFGDQGTQAFGVLREGPAVVAGELAFAVWHKGDLVRAHRTHMRHQVVEGVALDVEFAVRPGLHQRGQLGHVAGADVALVRARVDGDALRASLQAQLGCARHTGDAQMARIAQQRDFIDVDRQGHRGIFGVHKVWMSSIIWRVRKAPTPQW